MIISINDLQFKYHNKLVLDNLSLEVPENSIFGLLGLNGSGKTTLIKIMLGLIETKGQNVSVFHKSIESHKREILAHIGSFVEAPSLYPDMTGYNYLRLKQVILNLPLSAIHKTLEIVGLDNINQKKIKEYSLGMKQRLSIAFALLNDPELLILDEPTNGLDPEGIIDFRKLLMRLKNDHGKTIFVSSHILEEIQKTCTHVGILHKGGMKYCGEIKNDQSSFLTLKVDKLEQTLKILSELKCAFYVEDTHSVQIPMLAANDLLSVQSELTKHSILITGLAPSKPSLESLFLKITKA